MRRPLIILFAGIAAVTLALWSNQRWQQMMQVRTDYFRDDLPKTQTPPVDEGWVDRRDAGVWQVNSSPVVVKLACPSHEEDPQALTDRIWKSYAAAMEASRRFGATTLVSATAIDMAAREFDKGLSAALAISIYRGRMRFGMAGADLVEGVFRQLPAGSTARPYLAAALSLADREVELTPEETTRAKQYLAQFYSDRARSQAPSYFSWTPQLTQIWRFNSLLQQEFDQDHLEVPRAIAGAFKNQPALMKQYRDLKGLVNQVTNPEHCLMIDAIVGGQSDLAAIAKRRHTRRANVSFFQPYTTREMELLDREFPTSLPTESSLMRALIDKIYTGQVALRPAEEDGWYQYRSYALESLLVPSQGSEAEKLLLSASYKERWLRLFEDRALERSPVPSAPASSAVEVDAKTVRPALRLEPCPTFYLRTARAYAFLQDYLLAAVGEQRLRELYALKETGRRNIDLAAELDNTRLRFFGFYLLSCEDLGMSPELRHDELVDEAGAKSAALGWLDAVVHSEDLNTDSREIVRVSDDPAVETRRVWGIVGIRLMPLTVSFDVLPRLRKTDSADPWRTALPSEVGVAHYMIAVPDYLDFEIDRSTYISSSQWRGACDEARTKNGAIRAAVVTAASAAALRATSGRD